MPLVVDQAGRARLGGEEDTSGAVMDGLSEVKRGLGVETKLPGHTPGGVSNLLGVSNLIF